LQTTIASPSRLAPFVARVASFTEETPFSHGPERHQTKALRDDRKRESGGWQVGSLPALQLCT